LESCAELGPVEILSTSILDGLQLGLEGSNSGFLLGSTLEDFIRVFKDVPHIPSILLHINVGWSFSQCCLKPLGDSKVVSIIMLALILDILTLLLKFGCFFL